MHNKISGNGTWIEGNSINFMLLALKDEPITCQFRFSSLLSIPTYTFCLNAFEDSAKSVPLHLHSESRNDMYIHIVNCIGRFALQLLFPKVENDGKAQEASSVKTPLSWKLIRPSSYFVLCPVCAFLGSSGVAKRRPPKMSQFGGDGDDRLMGMGMKMK